MDYDICDMRFLNLNSSNATLKNNSYLSDVNFDFKNILTDDTDIKYVTCGILNCQIPVSFYTINYTNYLLEFSVNGGAIIPLIVTRGNYNSNSLITELVNQFILLGYTFTINTNKITGVMTFTSTGNNFIFYGTSTLFHILGFVFGTNYSSTSNSITAIYPLNLLGIKRLNINSTALSTNVYDSYGLSLSSNIASIPVNVPSFGLIDYVNASNAFPIMKSHTVSFIDIQIYDEDNNFINFNGINWTMTIQLNIFRKGRKENNNLNMKPVVEILNDIRDELAETTNNIETTNNDNIESTNNDIILPPEDDTFDDLDMLLYSGSI